MFMAGQTREINLPDDEPDVVATYLGWLSSKSVPLYLSDVDKQMIPDFSLLFRLYIFGDKIKDDTFCDHVLGVVCRALDRVSTSLDRISTGLLMSPSPECISFVYEGTIPSSPLRSLVAQNYTERFVQDWEEKHDFSICPKEFYLDVTRAFAKIRGKPTTESWHDRREQFFKEKQEVPEDKEDNKGNADVD